MSNLERAILITTSISGPLSVAHCARLRSLPRQQVYSALCRLREKNLVVRAARATYRVTRRGDRIARENVESRNLFSIILAADQSPGDCDA